jgi:SAM-dependent methyltransferase
VALAAAGGVSAGASSAQAASNATVWAAGAHVDAYANDVLTPVEVQLFVRYRDVLSRRVLDLGCGAGRVLAYLVMIGAEAHGIDLAPRMVEYCRDHLPAATVRVADVRTLSRETDGVFDAVLAPDNLLDVFDDRERREVLAGIRPLLAPAGLLIFSSHDLGWLEHNPGPREFERRSLLDSARKLLERPPAAVVRAVRNRREIAANRRRLAPLEQRHPGYAIVNDFPHNYSLLHYYIRRDDQERQLRELGLELVECLSADGRTVAPGGFGTTDSLYYVARPSG